MVFNRIGLDHDLFDLLLDFGAAPLENLMKPLCVRCPQLQGHGNLGLIPSLPSSRIRP
jgi:hypothetical protein